MADIVILGPVPIRLVVVPVLVEANQAIVMVVVVLGAVLVLGVVVVLGAVVVVVVVVVEVVDSEALCSANNLLLITTRQPQGIRCIQIYSGHEILFILQALGIN